MIGFGKEPAMDDKTGHDSRRRRLLCAGLFGLLPGLGAMSWQPARAAESPATSTAPVAVQNVNGVPDKSAFTLFNPTPAALMRDFNTNRPDVTEAPFTIDAGHVQVELSFLEFTHDNDRGLLEDQFNVLPADVRVGVLNNFEVDVMFEPYLNSLVHGRAPASQRQTGTGDTQIRGSLNLWGNDGGKTAGGVLAFVSLPTASGGFETNHVEGGVILPIAFQLPGGFDAGAMLECDFDRNAANDGYGVDLIHTITVGHDLLPHLGAYVEYVGISPISTDRTYLSYFDTGLTYAITQNVQFDVGVNFGISSRADDYTVFTGFSFRL
jgi:hypothetical protein